MVLTRLHGCVSWSASLLCARVQANTNLLALSEALKEKQFVQIISIFIVLQV